MWLACGWSAVGQVALGKAIKETMRRGREVEAIMSQGGWQVALGTRFESFWNQPAMPAGDSVTSPPKYLVQCEKIPLSPACLLLYVS